MGFILYNYFMYISIAYEYNKFNFTDFKIFKVKSR